MRSLRFALALLCAAPVTLHAQAVTVAIFPLSGFAIGQDGAALASAVREMLITEFAAKPELKLTERAALDEMMKNRNVVLSGAARDDQMTEIGKLLGAQYYVGGGMVFQSDAVRMDLRVVDTETGEIVNTFKDKGPPDKVITLVEEAVKKFSNLKVKQRVADVVVPVRSVLAFSRGLDYEKRGEKSRAAQMYQEAIRIFPDNADAKAALGRVN